MKNLLLLGALAALSLTSCKRDFTCECDDYEYTILESTRKAAKEQCLGPKGLGAIGDKDGDEIYEINEDDCELSKFKD